MALWKESMVEQTINGMANIKMKPSAIHRKKRHFSEYFFAISGVKSFVTGINESPTKFILMAAVILKKMTTRSIYMPRMLE